MSYHVKVRDTNKNSTDTRSFYVRSGGVGSPIRTFKTLQSAKAHAQQYKKANFKTIIAKSPTKRVEIDRDLPSKGNTNFANYFSTSIQNSFLKPKKTNYFDRY